MEVRATVGFGMYSVRYIESVDDELVGFSRRDGLAYPDGFVACTKSCSLLLLLSLTFE